MEDKQGALCPLFQSQCIEKACAWFTHEETGCCVPLIVEAIDTWGDDAYKNAHNLMMQLNEVINRLEK